MYLPILSVNVSNVCIMYAEIVERNVKWRFKETPITKVITCVKILPVKSKMAFLSRILILLAILLYEQYIHHTQASICPNMQFLSVQPYAYQSLLSYFLV